MVDLGGGEGVEVRLGGIVVDYVGVGIGGRVLHPQEGVVVAV